jgi:DNA-binding MarR family transcriptional regulator
VPLYEEDGLRLSELARRAKLSKQTMTTTIRLIAKAKLVTTRPDPADGRAICVFLTEEAHRFRPVAEKVLAKLERRALKVEGRDNLDQLRRWLRQFADI